MNIRDFIPPILYKIRNTDHRQTLFSSYEMARNSCLDQGFEQADFVRVIFQKTKNFVNELQANDRTNISFHQTQTLLAVSYALMKVGPTSLNVLDFGGACGAQFFFIKKFFPHIHFCWHVIEVPAMVDQARALESEELKFFADLESAKKSLPQVHLLHSSGTLQYVPKPYPCLAEFIETGAEYMFLSRLVLSTGGTDYFTVQTSRLSANGPGPLPEGYNDRDCRYPLTVIQKSKLEETIQQKYAIQFQMDDPSGVIPLNKEPVVGLSYFANRL